MTKSELRERIVDLIKASKTLDSYETQNGDTEALEYALNCIDYVESDFAISSKEIVTLNLNSNGEADPKVIKEVVKKLVNGVRENIQERKEIQDDVVKTEEREPIDIIEENIRALEKARETSTNIELTNISKEIRKNVELAHKIVMDCTRAELEV